MMYKIERENSLEASGQLFLKKESALGFAILPVPSMLLLSSPSIGVPVRPWVFPSSDGSISPHMKSFDANRRNPLLKHLVFFLTGKLLICNNFWVDVPSVFNSPLYRFFILFKLNHKKNPFPASLLNSSQPPAPPWLMINSTFVENARIPLGATVNVAGIIIRLPDMEKFSLATIQSLEMLVLCPDHYISDYPLYLPTPSNSQSTFLFYICSAHVFLSLSSSQLPCCYLKMDDLSNTFNATLNLTALETQIHSFSETPDHPEDDERDEPSAFLAVKLLTNRHYNSEAFKKRLKQMWPERFSINVLEKDPNFYTVEFGYFGDRHRVLIGQPFWDSFPHHALAQRLGEVLGRFIEVDTASLKETWGPYLRVCIEIDVSQPLPHGTGFHFHGMAAPVWFEFRFENLPDFCHYCRRLSHIVNHCHEFLAKCDSSSAPPLLRYDQSLGAKIRITSNPFYIACSRSRLRPHIAHPTSLAPASQYRPHQLPIISEGLFNEPTYAYGVQHLSQLQTTPLGFYMAHSSSNVLTSHTPNLNQPPLSTSTWLYTQATATATQHANTQGASKFLTQSNTIPTTSFPSPSITTVEQLTIPLPTAIPTSAETIMATNGAPQHVVPVSQAFSTILADLNSSHPLQFALGATSYLAPTAFGIRKLRPKRPDCLNAAEFRRMLKRTRNLAKSLDEKTVEEAGDAQRIRLEP
uniref:DUF4283 domain-containing protein n=1 Tax=Cannabis sativa TaxID=3483 RepID=A0A803NKF4_CANSA